MSFFIEKKEDKIFVFENFGDFSEDAQHITF